MPYEYFLVTRIGPEISIFCLSLFKEDIALTECVAVRPARPRMTDQMSLRGVCLGKGKVGFLFDEKDIIVAGLVGMFPSVQRAIECWRSSIPEPDDLRWRSITEVVGSAIRSKHHPRIIQKEDSG